ncbi:putative RING finger domain protein [Talaromyces proteolyticus]|uniref:RING finger domain protein n=1 Tax=Talaromyces proteolyticus TaxID=1131652 RepID=A0AAD4KUG2_9EURO|nr:putative RING finger domain protein [Talaromyces proteolyticus]KAH8697285.1 putative RING finger domain protein [Talaromyces proteolyticus]
MYSSKRRSDLVAPDMDEGFGTGLDALPPKRRARNEPPSKRRRQTATTPTNPKIMIDLTGFSDSAETEPPLEKSRKKATPATEKRAKRFRNHAPQSYLEKLYRARTQKMFVIRRTRQSAGGVPEEKVDMVGTTGNIYTVTISTTPWCSCPDSSKGNQCKHIVYVLVNVLKARAELQYQLAFLFSELVEMLGNSPIHPVRSDSGTNTDKAGKRKPIEGDCPICFMEFDAQNEQIVWCKNSCGNNIHKTCFAQWAATTQKRKVECVYCRAEWESELENLDAESLLRSDRVGADGYVNVAAELGLSGRRDYSTYNQFWVDRHLDRERYYPYRSRYYR